MVNTKGKSFTVPWSINIPEKSYSPWSINILEERKLVTVVNVLEENRLLGRTQYTKGKLFTVPLAINMLEKIHSLNFFARFKVALSSSKKISFDLLQ